MKFFYKCVKKNGVLELDFLKKEDEEKFYSYPNFLKEGDYVFCLLEKASKKEYDRHKNSAHFHAYLEESISHFDCIDKMCKGKVKNLKEILKAALVKIHPNFWRLLKDIDGNIFRFLFSFRISGIPAKKDVDGYMRPDTGDILMLTDKERHRAYSWCIEFLQSIQERDAKWVLPAWSEYGDA